jgi:hypothetical protein
MVVSLIQSSEDLQYFMDFNLIIVALKEGLVKKKKKRGIIIKNHETKFLNL